MIRGSSAGAENPRFSHEDGHTILLLRLLIARAANRDSLAWWDDEALTAPAGFLLERLFPVAPPLAARSLALRAALARHEGACTEIGGALHLYRPDADNADGLALRDVPLLPVPYPEAPIPTMDALREHLIALLSRPAQVKIVQRRNGGALQIAIPPCPAGVWAPLHRARSFAWAYLEGAPGQPVFPFVAE
ncbi:MAG: BrxE family protein [Verrucomicrobia bacterium]|nr:BrxE family protein [Verrucomicrobiota bacterium]